MIKYGEDKYFIGAIKFYNKKKNFGYIASNNCGLPNSKSYYQDYYINSSSFVDGIPLLNEAIVVFQIEENDSGRLRAVNVRRLSNSDEDISLAETYFGKHEKIRLKNNIEYNLFSSSNKYLLRIAASRFIYLIKTNDNRKPNITLEHFSHFISNYRTLKRGKQILYVFDIDFEHEEKQIWSELFFNLTPPEIVLILNKYPSVLKYIQDQDILLKWIKSIEGQNVKLEKLITIHANLQYTNEPASAKLKEIIDKNVLRKANIIEKDLFSRANATEQELRNELLPLMQLSDYDFKDIIRRFKFNNLLKDFKTTVFFKTTAKDKLFTDLNNFTENIKDEYIEQIENAIIEKTDELLSKNLVWDALYIIDKVDILKPDLKKQLKLKLLSPAKEIILNEIEEALSNDKVDVSLFRTYSIFKNHYDTLEINDITKQIKDKLIQSKSLNVLYEIINYDFFSKEDIIQRAIEIINGWTYKQMKYYLGPGKKHFKDEEIFRERIIAKAVELILKSATIIQYTIKGRFMSR